MEALIHTRFASVFAVLRRDKQETKETKGHARGRIAERCSRRWRMGDRVDCKGVAAQDCPDSSDPIFYLPTAISAGDARFSVVRFRIEPDRGATMVQGI